MLNNNCISIERYLNKKGVPFQKKKGELISKCIFNGCDEDSKGSEAHLYFNLETSQYNCKKCGESGNIVTLTKYFDDNLDEILLSRSGLSKERIGIKDSEVTPLYKLAQQYHLTSYTLGTKSAKMGTTIFLKYKGSNFC